MNIVKSMYFLFLAFALTFNTASWGDCYEGTRAFGRLKHQGANGEVSDNFWLQEANEMEGGDEANETGEEEDFEEFQPIIPGTLVTPDLQGGQPLFSPMTPALLEQLGLTPCTYAGAVRNLLALRNALLQVLTLADVARDENEDTEVVVQAHDNRG